MQRVSTYQNRIKALGIPGGIIDSQLAQNVHGIKPARCLDRTVARAMLEK